MSGGRAEGEGEMMPARPRHIPHNTERTALQKMSASRGLASAQLHPAGKQTIAGMVAKGWIEKRMDARASATYCVTPEGKAALEAKIPNYPRRR
jgi:DNA-binding MarR family transcriptional regulator